MEKAALPLMRLLTFAAVQDLFVAAKFWALKAISKKALLLRFIL